MSGKGVLATEPIKIKLISANGKMAPSSYMMDELKKLSLKFCKRIKILQKIRLAAGEQNMFDVLIKNFGQKYLKVDKTIVDNCEKA